MRSVGKASAIYVIIVVFTTVSLGYLRDVYEYTYQISMDGLSKSSIESNDFQFEITSKGVFPRNEKVLIATSSTDMNKPLVFAASRSSNIVKSFKIDRNNGELTSVSNYNLIHSQPLFKFINGIKKSNYYIFDLLASGTELFISIVETYPGNDACDDLKILSVQFDKNGSFVRERLVYKYNGCVRWRDDVSPSGNLSLRLTKGNSDDLYMSVGLEPLLPYTNIFPNDALQGLPENLSKTMRDHPIFGSVIRVKTTDVATQKFTLIARGLRSPQGILFRESEDGSRKIWISDHGPRGGDELNAMLVDREVYDFGWPNVTLGTYYSTLDENMQGYFPVRFGTHEGFVSPVFYWTPSIAPSQLTLVPKYFHNLSSTWKEGEIILATLKDQSLHHLVMNSEEQIVSDERIFVGERIRDIDSVEFGLILGSDSGKVIVVRPKRLIAHSGSFPPVEKYFEPQRVDFLSWLKSQLSYLFAPVETILGR